MSKEEDKEEAELGEESIQSSASLKKILQQLVVRNVFAYEVWGMACGRRGPPRHGGHHALLAHTQHAPVAPPGMPPAPPALSLPYRAALPAPLLLHTPAPLHLPDPITLPFDEIEDWFQTLSSMITHSNGPERQMYAVSEQVWVCAAGWIKAARHLASRPHRHLADSTSTSPHNYLWAGAGTLLELHLPAPPVRALALARHTTLSVYAWSSAQDAIGEPLCSYECGAQALELACAADLTLAVRTPHHIHLLRLHQGPDTTLTLRKVISNTDALFTSISVDPYHTNILYVSVLDDTKIFCDLDTLKVRRVKPDKKVCMTNNWNPIIGYDRWHYVRASQYKVRAYRKRDDAEQYSYDVRAVSDACNVITLVRRCEGTPLLYVGTAHHLLCVDMRAQQGVRGGGPRALAKWTHGMEAPPALLASAPYPAPGQQLACLASQRAGELSLLVCEAARLAGARPPTAAALPYRPPAPRATLHEAQARARLLDPVSADIARRLRTCTAGLAISRTDTGYRILTLNALGDLMAQELVPENMEQFVSDDSVERLVRWADGFSVAPGVWDVTRLYDLGEFWAARGRQPEQLQRPRPRPGPRPDTRAVPPAAALRDVRAAATSADFDVALFKIWNVDPPDAASDAESVAESLAESDVSGDGAS